MGAAARKRLARDLATRCHELSEALGPSQAERRTFEELFARGDVVADAWPELYQDFLDAFDPALRRSRGVYYTPAELVGAQVQLVDDVLRQRLGRRDGLADPGVLIVDPCAGSGAYPLAILDLVGEAAAPSVVRRMRLFETLPGAACAARAAGLGIEERDVLSAHVAFEAPVVVCLGNPPYRRQRGDAQTQTNLGGLSSHTPGVHLKNLHNAYVYFWRWSLRHVFEARAGGGLVCLVTAASYLRGPAFAGLRCKLRQLLDDLWIVDLEGDHLAARKTDNVFAIRTPVAVALGIRHAASRPDVPAAVHYARIAGSRQAKLGALQRLQSLDDLTWHRAATDCFVPPADTAYQRWPRLTDLFPWQVSGAQLKRTWPIGPTAEVLRERWRRLLQLAPDERAAAFRQTRDRNLDSASADLYQADVRLKPLRELPADAACLEPVRYAYRSFDRQWVLPDARLGDFMRPALWRAAGPRQLYLTSLLTNVLGPGPAVVATALVPDLDHFRGSFGARAVIPLWRDAAASRANVANDSLSRLADTFGFPVGPEALMAYCYALLVTRSYTARFTEELRAPGSRVPMTSSPDLFRRALALGQRLLAIHTFRLVPRGAARCLAPVGDAYPRHFTYDPDQQVLQVGDGLFGPISREVWDYGVSGLAVVRSWVRRRMPKKGTSVLDAIGPPTWTAVLTGELLEVLWLLEATLDLEPALDELLDEIVSGGLCQARRVAAPEQGLDGIGAERSGEHVALPLVTAELLEASPL